MAYPRTTSRARMRALSMAAQSRQMSNSMVTMAAEGMVSSRHINSGAPSMRRQSWVMTNGMLSRNPHLVRRTPVIMPPTPEGTNTAAKMMPVVTALHLTQEERASPRMDNMRIQRMEPNRRPDAI